MNTTHRIVLPFLTTLILAGLFFISAPTTHAETLDQDQRLSLFVHLTGLQVALDDLEGTRGRVLAAQTTEEELIADLLAQVARLRAILAAFQAGQSIPSVSGAQSITINGLPWREGARNNVGSRLIKKSNDAYVSIRLSSRDSSDSNRLATVGFNHYGGGYINELKLQGYPGVSSLKNLAVPDYGGGWQSTLRDQMHHGRYNPAQTGYRNDYGNRVSVAKVGRAISIPQFNASLWDDGYYDFFLNETASGPNEIQDISWFPDGGHGDADFVDDATETSIDDEILSGFDFASETSDVSAHFGIPAFMQKEYYAYARMTPAIRQFIDARSEISHPVGSPDVGEKVFTPAKRVRDISESMSGNQTPQDTDLSDMVQTKSIRITRDFAYMHYKTGGEWKTAPAPTTVDAPGGLVCEIPTDGHSYVYDESGDTVRYNSGDDCALDVPIVILSTSPNRNEGAAVGLYVPQDAAANAKQISIVDKDTGTVTTTEDRRVHSIMMVILKKFPAHPDGYYILATRNYLSGLLSPESATQYYGADSMEAFTQENYFLFGTPQEIIKAIGDSAPAPAGTSCTIGGETLQNGESKTFYSNSVAPTGESCSNISTVRTCTSGTLSGESIYTSASCTDSTLDFRPIAAFQLTNQWASCSPDDTSSVRVRVLRYKFAGTGSSRDPLYAFAYLPNTSSYVNGPDDKLPVIALFHGGGLKRGNPLIYFSRMAPRIASKGIAVFAFQYRIESLHGTSPLEASQDAVSAMKWLKKNADTLGINPNRMMAVGMSAGGHLGIMSGLPQSGLDLEYLNTDGDHTSFNLDGVSAFYPWTTLPQDQAVSPSHLTERLISAGGVYPVPLSIHLGALDQGPLVNGYAEPFCALVDNNGGQCELTITPGVGHNFASTVAYPEALDMLADDMHDFLNLNVDFASDDTTASPICSNAASTLSTEWRKYDDYICGLDKYKGTPYCS